MTRRLLVGYSILEEHEDAVTEQATFEAIKDAAIPIKNILNPNNSHEKIKEDIQAIVKVIDNESAHSIGYVEPSREKYTQGCSNLLPKTIGEAAESTSENELIIVERKESL
mmetsp:Transcript_13446/g.29120  ORF Transcript_13446/g.29120 Transcript_13446/m.29120 type:complete len:111 (+) Transcript_13446:637-969(+)